MLHRSIAKYVSVTREDSVGYAEDMKVKPTSVYIKQDFRD